MNKLLFTLVFASPLIAMERIEKKDIEEMSPYQFQMHKVTTKEENLTLTKELIKIEKEKLEVKKQKLQALQAIASYKKRKAQIAELNFLNSNRADLPLSEVNAYLTIKTQSFFREIYETISDDEWAQIRQLMSEKNNANDLQENQISPEIAWPNE